MVTPFTPDLGSPALRQQMNLDVVPSERRRDANCWRCLGHTKHDLAVFLATWRSRPTGRHPMNPWQVRGDVLPGLGHILERIHGRDVWSYRPLFQQSPDSAEHVP